jgi:hypothetical protein
MSRRTFRRIAVLALVSSLGVLSIPRAEAAPSRSGTGAVIQTDLSLRTFVYSVINFLRSLSAPKDDPPPNNPGNDPTGNHEGSSGSPLGRPPGQG